MKPNGQGASRRSLMMLTCTVASMLVVIAVAATAASAATPEYWKSGSPIKSKIPYTWSGGQLEWKRFIGSEAYEIWQCSSSEGEGELVNSTEGKFKLTLKKCKWNNPHGEIISCTSKSHEAGTIVTEPLKSHLYYAHSGLKGEGAVIAAMDLSAEKGETVASFACSASELEVSNFEWRGSVLGTFEKVNEEGTTNHLILKQQPPEEKHTTNYRQEPETYETLTSECKTSEAKTDHLEQRLNLAPWQYIALDAPDTITFKESVKIHAPCVP